MEEKTWLFLRIVDENGSWQIFVCKFVLLSKWRIMGCYPIARLVSVPNTEYFHKNKNLQIKTAKQNILMQCSIYPSVDQGQVTKYFCGISFVMYLVFYNYSNEGPECQATV